MKKIIYIFSARALMAGFSACTEKESDINLDEIVLDGFYVYGDATGAGNSAFKERHVSRLKRGREEGTYRNVREVCMA